MLQIKCPKCGQLLQIPAGAEGRAVRCPSCGQLMAVRGPSGPAPAPPAVVRAEAPAQAAPPPAAVPPPPRPAPTATPQRAADEPPGLGETRADYRPARWWVGLGIAAGVTVLALVLTLLAYRKVWYTKPNPEPGEPPLTRWRYAGSSTARNLLPLAVLAAGVATLYFLVQTLRSLKLRLVVCDRGFRYRRWWRQFTCRWDEIDSVYYISSGRQSALVPERHFCEINKSDGDSVVLPSLLQRLGQACATIKEEAHRSLRPRALAALRRGEAVAFGENILLAPHGLTSFRSHLDWEDIGAATVENDHLVVTQRDRARPGLALYLGGVANADTLADLLGSRHEVAAGLPRGHAQASPSAAPRGTGKAAVRGGYVCPRCGGLAERAARGGAGGAGGLAGALLGLAFGSFSCKNCGVIGRGEFPPAIRRRMTLHSVYLVAAGVLCLVAAVALAVALRHK